MQQWLREADPALAHRYGGKLLTVDTLDLIARFSPLTSTRREL